MKFCAFTAAAFTGAMLGLVACQGPARSADLRPVAKAPVGFFDVAGWYGGASTLAVTTNATVDLPEVGASGKITTVGAGAGAVFGYHKGSVASFWEAECDVYVMNLGGSQLSINGADVKTRYAGGCRGILGGTRMTAALGQILPKIGGGIFSDIPVAGQGTLPFFSLGFHASQVRAVIVGLEDTKGTQVVPLFGTGFKSIITDPLTGRPTGWVTSTSVEYAPPGKGVTLGGSGGEGTANLGRQWFAKFQVIRHLGGPQ